MANLGRNAKMCKLRAEVPPYLVTARVSALCSLNEMLLQSPICVNCDNDLKLESLQVTVSFNRTVWISEEVVFQ